MTPTNDQPGESGQESGLREQLIQAGIDILTEGEPLTLRGAARRAGVSHAAPAHHFPGLSGLETAVAARAFEMLESSTREATEAAQGDDFDRLLASTRAYCDFAEGNFALFQLMFVSPSVDRTDPALAATQQGAWQQLREVCAPLMADVTDPALLETAVWSITHGYAMLHLHRANRDCAPQAAPPLAPLLRMVVTNGGVLNV